MRKVAKIFFTVLGNSVFVLVVGLVLQGISASGIIGMGLAHVFFWIAFALTVGGTLLAGLRWQSWRNAVISTLCVVAIAGLGLWWIDDSLHRMKKEQDAANQPPKPLPSNVPPPAVPIVKAQRREPLPRVKIEQHGNNNSAIGGNVRQGPCSILQNGGSGNSATVNCAPAQRELTERQRQSLSSIATALPEGIKVYVSCVQSNDPKIYSMQFAKSFGPRLASWEQYVLPHDPEYKGIWLSVNPKDQMVGQSVADSMIKAGIEMDDKVSIDASMPKGLLHLVVGNP